MSKSIELSDEQYTALADLAAARGETADQVLADVLDRLTQDGWLLILDRSGSIAGRTTGAVDVIRGASVLDYLTRQPDKLALVLLDLTMPVVPSPGPVYDNVDDFARHLGASEGVIRDSERLARELFPPDETSEAAADHADA